MISTNKTVFPLTQSQLGVYIESVQRKGECCYNIPLFTQLPPTIEIERLAQALRTVATHHPYISCRITHSEMGEPMLSLDPTAEIIVTTETSATDDGITERLIRPFDVDEESLYRFHIIQAPAHSYLFIDIHHILFDGTSMMHLLPMIEQAYRGETLTPEQVTPLEIALTEQELRASAHYDEAKAWHDKQLNGLEGDSLPIASQKNPQTGLVTASLTTRLSYVEASAFCAEHHIGKSVLFNAAFAYFLSTYNNTPDISYATIYTGRKDPRTLETITMMVQTLPIYQRIEGIETPTELVGQMKEQLKGAMEHDIFSFADACQHYDFPPGLFFAYQGDTFNTNVLFGEPVAYLEPEDATHPMTIQVYKTGEHFLVNCAYRTDLYDGAMIEALLASFDQVLSDFIRCERLADISLVSPQQIEELDAFNQTELPYDESLTVLDLIDRQVAEQPDHLAVVYQERSYTYAEVDHITKQIAAHIIQQGVKAGEVVAILIPRCEYMPIASLGVLRAGCIYQPLDPTYPAERLEFMLKDTAASLLIADEALLGLIPRYEGDVILTSSIPSLQLTAEDEALVAQRRPSPESHFIILYTSGSTGLPKGCIIAHKNVTAFIYSCRELTQHGRDTRQTSYASFGFDASMYEIYATLSWGGTLHVIADEIRLDLIALGDYFRTHQITHAFMTTQVGRQFALELGDDTTLRHLTVGGEKLVPIDAPTAFTIHNAYGPTEGTVYITDYPLSRQEENIPIGTPNPNVKIYITDPQGRRQPIGGVGELWMSGPQVTQGYLNRPEVTAQAYITNPFATAPYDRIYRTGDIVRYLTDGQIEFIGRKDAQVKIRGFRIELTEVEAIIRDFPTVKDATVQAYDAEGGGKYIAAFIVGNEPIDIEGLRAFILENKPPYIVPAVIMQIEAIPLNQNQKVNKKALPKPELQQASMPDDEAQRPLNRLEEEIKAMAASIVGSDAIPLSSPLGYAGLTSITSIKFAVLLFKRFGITVDSKRLAKELSIVDLEDLILEQLLTAPKANQPATQATEQTNVTDEAPDQDAAYPLSYAQQGVYYECMKDPTKTTYNIPFILRYPKRVTTEAIVAALHTLIERNPMLRVQFEMQNGEVMQSITQHDYTIETLTLTTDELTTLRQRYVQPFNLSRDLLFRFTCVATDEAHYLLMDIHHLIFDGASCDLFIQQLNTLLDGATLPLSDYSYFDYIKEEKRNEEGETYQAHKTFFAQQLAQCEGGSTIPTDRNDDPTTARLASVELPVSATTINAYCRQLGVTPAQYYLAAAMYTVSRYVNSKQVYLSTISNGRSDLRTADTYGMLVKTLPIAAVIGDQHVEAFIQEVAETFEQTIAHEAYPYAKIASDYHFSPEIMYAYQVGVINRYTVGGEEITIETLGLEVPKFKLAIHIESRNGRDCIVLEYNDALYSEAIMHSLAQSLDATLSHFLAAPSSLLKQTSIVSPAQQLALDSYHTATTAAGTQSTFHSGIERIALLQPNHLALEACDGSYTYQAFNEQANRIAHALLHRGIEVGDRVMLLLPRCSSLLFAMFGVMKAGAAYIPCDTKYPQERIAHIMEDAGARYIITTADRIAEYAPNQASDRAIDRAIDIEELLAEPQSHNPALPLTPNDLAYLIYTSGSTGKPKGVVLRHGGITNYLHNHPGNIHIHALCEEATKYLSVTTISFDMSLKEVGAALYNGVTLVLANEEQANNPILLAELFAQTGADAFNATPSRMLQYMELPAFSDALAHCRIIMSGGEKYSLQLLERLQQVTSARLFNTYGPTEITVSSNAQELTHATEITIGRPLLNYTEWVVDSDGNELPAGVVGELYIGGIGVAKGYHNLEEMTAKQFVDYQGQRVYRSGDYACWDSEGGIKILGRTDNQVKLRGLRIELGEIETSLTKIEGIKSAVTMISTIGDKEHIAAYYTADSLMEPLQIKEALATTLTPYMIPTAYLQLDALPITPNGKTDLKALPPAKLLITSEHEEAATALEQSLCDIFAEILELDSVGATDNFFEIGGSSLIATRVIINAANQGYQLAYGDLFANPTPRALAQFITHGANEEDEYADLPNYNYAMLEPVLKANNLTSYQEGERKPMKRVLLVGASGFLGIHLLKELIEHGDATIYCLLRSRGEISAEERLKSLLFYYFEHTYAHLFHDRLFVIEGDIHTVGELEIEPVDTVINAAAIVKHFSESQEIYEVNEKGVLRLIGYCLANDARLIHVSTMSVSGFALYPDKGTPFMEDELYKGQLIQNKYIHSKFLAERHILEHITEKGLDAKIMRVGNLSARNTDGEFQINFDSNSFMNRLRIFNILGRAPYKEQDTLVEFSPIDAVARAILLLSEAPKACCVFHPYNNHSVFMGDIFAEMTHLGIMVEPVEQSQYAERLEAYKNDPEKAKHLTSIIAYENMSHGRRVEANLKQNNYTMQVLYRMGYRWPQTSWDYVERFVESLIGFGYFKVK